MYTSSTIFCVTSIFNIFFCFVVITENILKYYRIFDMHIPTKMLEKNKQFFIGEAIDKIRSTFEIDKYNKEQQQIGKS